MNVPNLFVGLNSVILIFLVVNVFKPFFGSYAAKKGENLATKEDIAQLTEIAEGIKAKISDEVWDRQEQWRLKRDAIQNAVLTYHELENKLELFNFFHEHTARNNQEAQETLTQFFDCFDAYRRAMLMIDLVVGRRLSTDLASYLQFAGQLVRSIDSEKRPLIDDEKSKLIAEHYKTIIKSAREALGITGAGEIGLKPADFNRSLTTDN